MNPNYQSTQIVEEEIEKNIQSQKKTQVNRVNPQNS
jgi:hypothetical protein